MTVTLTRFAGGHTWAFVVNLLTIFPFLSGCLAHDVIDPEKVKELKPKLIELRSAESLPDDDFGDLMPLQDFFKGKQFIALGEQSHADGTTFAMKVRLIQFLHQKMGFDMLVFESGFYSGYEAWKSVPQPQDPSLWFARHVIPAWGASAECKPLFDYLAKHRSSKTPLQMLGMDCRLHGPGNLVLTDELAKIVSWQSENPLNEPQKIRLEQIAKTLLEGTARPDATTAREQIEAAVAFAKHLKSLEPNRMSEDENATWQQFASNLPDNLEFIWLSLEGMKGKPDLALKAAELRDKLMASYILWMANYYKERKFIVWAASTHISRELEKTHSVDFRFPDALYQKSNIRPMGHHVHETLKDQWYAIGFTALEGEVGSALGDTSQKLLRPTASSLESVIGQSGYENAFLDIGSAKKDVAWLNQPQVARPFGYLEMKAPWPEIMDAIIFTKTMKRATRR